MRTVQRDHDGYTTFSAKVIDAAAGSGVASPGLPYTLTRVATGTWDIAFDNRILPISVTASADGNPDRLATVQSIGAGTFRVQRSIASVATQENGNFYFTMIARDKRQ